MSTLILLSPIVVVLIAAIYFFICGSQARPEEYDQKQIMAGDRGEDKVRAVIGSLEGPNPSIRFIITSDWVLIRSTQTNTTQ